MNQPIGLKRVAAVTAEWRQVATVADRQRLRGWRPTWLAAVAAARISDGGAIARDPALFEPDRSLNGAIPPAGAYRCRVFKLGGRSGSAMPGFVAYPYFDCRIDDAGDVVGFAKVTGSQRPVGLLFPDGPARAIFLGTLRLWDEASAMEYGAIRTVTWPAS